MALFKNISSVTSDIGNNNSRLILEAETHTKAFQELRNEKLHLAYPVLKEPKFFFLIRFLEENLQFFIKFLFVNKIYLLSIN